MQLMVELHNNYCDLLQLQIGEGALAMESSIYIRALKSCYHLQTST